ncbi:hypothetical protein [Clostridium intestinale]|uniref:Uncharacterized protein n=1 Tax=Clostridium intestinale TaxID=36845 RepID=A0A7D7A5J1_9CLOT|nr:hypothetical protein [Clostridium intestinale]QLY81200.1 hypothetical protein HZF06_06325 [Clostridium intestinale]
MLKTIRDLRRVWRSLCLSTKFLTVICFASLSYMIITTFSVKNINNSSDEAIRSIMLSIFGYIFGQSNNSVIESIGSRRFRIYVAGFVALITTLILIISEFTLINLNSAPIGEFKNLLFASVGFLTSMSKALSDVEDKNYLSKSKKNDIC